MEKLIDKIKQKGYWKVIIRPVAFREDYIPNIEDCKRIIESCVVSRREWNYPHIEKEGARARDSDSVESYCDWEKGGHFEHWQFYRSGQFIYYFSMKEDYTIGEEEIKIIQSNHYTNSKRFLNILSTLYLVTEIFELAQHLAAKEVFGGSFEVIIELGNLEGKELFFWDPPPTHLSKNYIYPSKDKNIIVKRISSKQKLMSKFDKIALDACIEIFKKFNWSEIPKNVFAEEQKKFLQSS